MLLEQNLFGAVDKIIAKDAVMQEMGKIQEMQWMQVM